MTFDVTSYWDRRYREGRTSGAGSEGAAAQTKADFVNRVLSRTWTNSVIDWGVGDGTVLDLLRVEPDRYVGIDVSATTIARLDVRFPEHSFLVWPFVGRLRADLALSLDVLFHLIDGIEFVRYLDRLFASARHAVIIGSTDSDGGRTARHVLRRPFTPVVADRFPDWRLTRHEPGPDDAGLHLYERA